MRNNFKILLLIGFQAIDIKHVMQDAQDSPFVLTINLIETKHASWLAGKGNKQLINVYNACVSDLANALLQSAKMLAFIEG